MINHDQLVMLFSLYISPDIDDDDGVDSDDDDDDDADDDDDDDDDDNSWQGTLMIRSSSDNEKWQTWNTGVHHTCNRIDP